MRFVSSAAGNLPPWRRRATVILLLLAVACTGDEPPCEVLAAGTLPPPLREASGAVVDDAGRIWMLADSGDPVLFQVDSAGNIANTLELLGVRNDDWEDLGMGPCPTGTCLYVGAFGDNLHQRPYREILRVPLPAADETPVQSRPERFRFSYADGPSDAEALAVLADASVLIITKGRNRAATVYRYAPPFETDSARTLEPVQTLTEGIVQIPDQITGAATPDGEHVLVRSYTAFRRYRWTGDSLVTAGEPVDLRFLREEQGEAIAPAPDGTLILTSEGFRTGTWRWLRCAGPG